MGVLNWATGYMRRMDQQMHPTHKTLHHNSSRGLTTVVCYISRSTSVAVGWILVSLGLKWTVFLHLIWSFDLFLYTPNDFHFVICSLILVPRVILPTCYILALVWNLFVTFPCLVELNNESFTIIRLNGSAQFARQHPQSHTGPYTRVASGSI